MAGKDSAIHTESSMEYGWDWNHKCPKTWETRGNQRSETRCKGYEWGTWRYRYSRVCHQCSRWLSATNVYFPRKRIVAALLNGAPPESVGYCSPNGWIDADVFVKWLEHFAASTNACTENHQIIIMDGHHSHKSLAAITFARSKDIQLLVLPPHCTHRMQPLDTTFFKSAYNNAVDSWMVTNPGRRMSFYDMAGVFNTTWPATNQPPLTNQSQDSGHVVGGLTTQMSSLTTILLQQHSWQEPTRPLLALRLMMFQLPVLYLTAPQLPILHVIAIQMPALHPMNLQELVLLLLITQLLTSQRTKRLSLYSLLGVSPRHRLRRSFVTLLRTYLHCWKHHQHAASRENRNPQPGCRHRRIKTHLRRKVKHLSGRAKESWNRRGNDRCLRKNRWR